MVEPGTMEICGSLPPFLLGALTAVAFDWEATRPPTKIIGHPEPLLSRWRMHQVGDIEANLHVFHRSDDDRAKHDHPWESLSICLRAGAIDVPQYGEPTPIVPGMMIYRSASYAHWIEVEPGTEPMTLFITGPRVREWGFLCDRGWRHWRDFTAPTAAGGPSGTVGAGCD